MPRARGRPVYSLTDSKPSKLDPYKDQIVFWLEEAPYSAARILEKIAEQGFEGGYTIVKQFVRSKKEQLNEQATVRFETMPGLQAQVDWAFFENYFIKEAGEKRKLYCFLMIIGLLANAIHRVRHRHDNRHPDTLPHQRFPVF